MPPNKLNAYTKEELQAALAKYLNEQATGHVNCRWCGKGFERNRRWQEYCSVKCKSTFHKHEKDLAIKRLEARASALEHDLDLHKRLWARVPAEWKALIEAQEV